MLRFKKCQECNQIVPSGPPLCTRCGFDFDCQPTDNYLRDVVSLYRINETDIWIFPTCIFGKNGMAYWMQAEEEGEHYSFMEILCPDDVERGHQCGQLCDAVVDSANNYLVAGSGLARWLDEQIGGPYQQAKRELLTRNRKELVRGRAYFLPLPRPFGRVLRGVIEAISIRYTRRANGGLEIVQSNDTHIRSCVQDALLQAHEHALRSVAIPQMASRSGYSIYSPRVAPVVMVNATLNAIVTFLSEVIPTSLRRICLHPADIEAEEQMIAFFSSLRG